MWLKQSETVLDDELLPLITPGEVLRAEFMEPLGITPYRLAKDIGVQQTRIGEILEGRRAITPDTAERLGRYFSMGTAFWLNLQHSYDLRKWLRDRDETIYERNAPRKAAA